MGLLWAVWRKKTHHSAWTDEEFNQTIIAGMGELHLDIIVDPGEVNSTVKAKTGKPQAVYREAIRATPMNKHASETMAAVSITRRRSTKLPPAGISNWGVDEFINSDRAVWYPGEYPWLAR
ncbi:hypothetical protein Q5M43_22425 [Enterobacter hormaechei subsp. xiangfangensis]